MIAQILEQIYVPKFYKERNKHMKKLTGMLLGFLMVLLLSGCGGDVSGVKVLENKSNIYSKEDIEKAIDVTKNYFRSEFTGCGIGFWSEAVVENGGMSIMDIRRYLND